MELPPGFMHFTLRRLQPGDAPLLAMFYQTLSPRTRHFFEPYKDTSQQAMQDVVDRAVSGRDLSLVALDPTGNVFAHLFVWEAADPASHLGVGIHDAYQGLGLGGLFLGHLMQAARAAYGRTTLRLTVMKDNARAVRLYQRLGFKVQGEVTFRTEKDSYEMTKTYSD